LSGITSTKDDIRIDKVILDARQELEELREEIGKYKVVFDSARLIVSHEFIKPIMAISGYLELLEDGFDGVASEKDQRYFGKIKESVGRLEKLVQSFVQMLRFDSRVGSISEIEKVNLHALVEKVRMRFGEEAKLVANAVSSEIGDVWIRRNSFEVVLENLIANAIEHGGDTSPVSVRVQMKKERRRGSNEKIIVVSVEDCGPGIPEDKIQDIFNPFYRIGEKRDGHGLGLGLALVKSIITIMKGEIYVKSTVGKGTTVTCTIPVPEEITVHPDRVG